MATPLSGKDPIQNETQKQVKPRTQVEKLALKFAQTSTTSPTPNAVRSQESQAPPVSSSIAKAHGKDSAQSAPQKLTFLSVLKNIGGSVLKNMGRAVGLSSAEKGAVKSSAAPPTNKDSEILQKRKGIDTEREGLENQVKKLEGQKEKLLDTKGYLQSSVDALNKEISGAQIQISNLNYEKRQLGMTTPEKIELETTVIDDLEKKIIPKMKSEGKPKSEIDSAKASLSKHQAELDKLKASQTPEPAKSNSDPAAVKPASAAVVDKPITSKPSITERLKNFINPKQSVRDQVIKDLGNAPGVSKTLDRRLDAIGEAGSKKLLSDPTAMSNFKKRVELEAKVEARFDKAIEGSKTKPPGPGGLDVAHCLNALKELELRKLSKLPDEKVIEMQKGVTLIATDSSKTLAAAFLKELQDKGSVKERAFYKNMTPEEFCNRLMNNRPLMMCGPMHEYILADGSSGFARPGPIGGPMGTGPSAFETVGQDGETPPMTLENTLSMKEMEIAANFAFIMPTTFINDGTRGTNPADGGKEDVSKDLVQGQSNFIKEGFVLCGVGLNFEMEGQMEHQFAVCDGSDRVIDPKHLEYLGLNADDFKNMDVNDPERFVQVGVNESGKPQYLDLKVVDAFINKRLEADLLAANELGKKQGKPVYIHAVGLGGQAWATVNGVNCAGIITGRQMQFYEKFLADGKGEFIKDIDCSWFPGIPPGPSREVMNQNGEVSRLHITKNSPGQIYVKEGGKIKLDNDGNPIPIAQSDAKRNGILVRMFAGDGASEPGNESHKNSWNGSDDPTAAVPTLMKSLYSMTQNWA